MAEKRKTEATVVATQPSDAKKSAEVIAPSAKKKKNQVSFKKNLPMIMHGYGDHGNPFDDTVDLLDDIAKDFITDLTAKALGKKRGALSLTELLYAIRKDKKKFYRATEMIHANTNINEAKKKHTVTKDS